MDTLFYFAIDKTGFFCISDCRILLFASLQKSNQQDPLKKLIFAFGILPACYSLIVSYILNKITVWEGKKK